MIKIWISTGLFIMIALSSTAQTQPAPCSQQEALEFDFWLGEWNLQWENRNAEVIKGTNKVQKTLGGCVIQETFNGGDKMKLRGLSVSVYDAQSKKWKQTWVDNNGAYLDFVGSYQDGKMILCREHTTPEGKKVLQRMVFYNITPDSLHWNWEASKNNGKSWDVLWKIVYTRNK